ncbi:helix-turn-helix and ligand-binding sensor domain-containing protein [Gaetbulibacter saemankumensis]|uniref:helix-turn-helix and ligand-binding sensor domain-containing protein n=1 Tax=Gaetbulibacter saemankumensis TaxID=311208 RepID=UPI000413E065|nr:triple tyrosine motif-containing protein [Gaetbulibacter saemankumensis]
MRSIKLLLTAFFLLNFFLSVGQEHPPIQVYTPNEYGAENQNWAISQSEDKYIYVANNEGLLEFNGAKWELFNSPNQTIIRSVKVIDNLIYTGCYKEFGFWKRDHLGVLNYTSLSEQLDIFFLEDEEIWNIIPVDNFILFQSLKRIYVVDVEEKSYSIINSKTTIYKAFNINEGIYFQKARDGIYEIKNGKAQLIFDDPIFKNNLLVNIFNHKGTLYFQTEDKGFYYLENDVLKSWDIPANQIILKDRIYSSIRLKDGSFILGTISNGIVHILPDGEISYQLNQDNGLSNNTVLSVFEDVDSNIWLGLENGINCINIKSPFQVYNDHEGKIGSINSSIVFNNNLYIGTNRGLFYRSLKSVGEFTFMPGTKGAVWCLTEINNTLFCGHNTGTFVVENNQAQLISNIQGTWSIKTIENHDNLLLQGNYTGLYVLENKKGIWQLRNKIQDFDISSRYFEMPNSSEVLISHEYKGVFKIKLDDKFMRALSISQVTSVNKGSKTGLIKYQDHVLYTSKDGIFKYENEHNKFIRDSILSQLFDKSTYVSGKLVNDEASNKLWSFNLHGLNYVTPSKLSDILKINRISLPAAVRHDVSGYENISYLGDEKYLYGNTQGYLIINLKKINYSPQEVKINSILNRNFKNSSDWKYVETSKQGVFKNNENNLEFHYSVPEYNKYLLAEYQYKLEGIYNEWSTWTTKSSEVFENLPYGEYTFKVRSRIGNEVSPNIESYAFNISRPWYISNMAISGYIIFMGLFALFMHNLYKRHYKKQQEKLLRKTQRELELKELENKEQTMRFNNEKLKQDIESKNRELGISTMSLIKKNELLNDLKNELENSKADKNIKRVIRIIDKNLNNTDDWHVFEEAFNNADKDFLKKMKDLHPTLTSNDLRLCAYLRLNLSSKEIAPLLNISSRSVEVKRYRLRKKLDLAHEASLTDYILEI